jgi:hypothetical protein
VYGCSTRRAVAVVGVDLAEVDVQAHEVPALAGDDEQVAAAARLDRGLEPDVGEVGHGEDVQHAPGVVGGVPAKLEPDRLPDAAPRAVAADHVSGANRELAAGAAQGDPYGAVARAAHRHVHDLDAVVGLEPGR